MRYVIYNPLSCNGKGNDIKNKFLDEYKSKFDDLVPINGLTLKQDEFRNKLNIEDEIILIGGDGTINVFLNKYLRNDIKNKIFLYGGGSGNDFSKDIGTPPYTLVEITKYLKNCPYVIVKGGKRYFLNNVGFGIDGKVCYTAEELKKKKKKFNYTAIAAKLLLLLRKKVAVVRVDGKRYVYKNVILAASMNGKYYGGGMKNAPDQDRLSDELTLVVLHARSNLHAMFRFPKMIKGEHYKYKKIVAIHKGKSIDVTFNKPEYIQVDGEVLGKYTHYKAIKEINNEK